MIDYFVWYGTQDHSLHCSIKKNPIAIGFFFILVKSYSILCTIESLFSAIRVFISLIGII